MAKKAKAAKVVWRIVIERGDPAKTVTIQGTGPAPIFARGVTLCVGDRLVPVKVTSEGMTIDPATCEVCELIRVRPVRVRPAAARPRERVRYL